MTNLKSDEVISWFGNEEEYQNFHLAHHHENDLSRLIIEF